MWEWGVTQGRKGAMQTHIMGRGRGGQLDKQAPTLVKADRLQSDKALSDVNDGSSDRHRGRPRFTAGFAI